MTEWIFAFLISVVPPSHHAWRGERADVAAWRYARWAETIAEVAEAEPLPDGPAWTALLLATTLAHESFLRRDVIACLVPGHGGAVPAWGAYQLARPRAEACGAPADVTRAALAAVRRSLEACRELPAEERLAVYTGGACDRGRAAARVRWRRAAGWMRAAGGGPKTPAISPSN